MSRLTLLLLVASAVSCLAFNGGEDRFVRKYAMMKVYESCFGPDVVKEVRKEMRAACAKCAAMSTPKPEGAPAPATTIEKKRPTPQFDPAKLQQAILGFKQQNAVQTAPQYFAPTPYYSPQPLYYPAPQALYNPAGGMYPAPVYPQQQQAAFYPGYYPTAAASTHRTSRDMDLRSQLESLTSRISGRVRNVTCVMQELGYLDANLEPNFPRIVERINRLPVEEELRKDMIDGVEFCQKFSQCIPEQNKDKYPLSKELMKPMFFFKCYKHKKLEACVMKDIRERYQPDDLGNEEEAELRSFTGEVDTNDLQDMATGMYDFFFGAGGPENDGIF
ncbi:uncharacterized protein [Anabrus simplex]|uniref:uncharacterized protein n=1 Tax=Anabrus simplex TaxID=316456 RepID=UPI0035A31E2C